MPGKITRALYQSLLLLSFALALSLNLSADPYDGPLISIVSPDTAATYVYGSIKDQGLIWNNKEQLLIIHVTFINGQDGSGYAREDIHDFRIPGVTLDEAKGIFFARSAKGEIVPVARIRKTLFIKSIETLPNSAVHIQMSRGNVSVTLNAVSPDDPGLHGGTNAAPANLEDLLH
jgi:hypothetical protein